MRNLTASLAVAALATLGTAGCGDQRSPTAPSATIDVALSAVLSRAIQDEYRAETTYQVVVNDFGQVLPFNNVLTAEERHSASIGRLYATRGLATPSSAWSPDQAPHFTSLPAACAAGAEAERGNIAMYDELLQGTLPADVRQVFTNNRSASIMNHLPAFERCS